MRAALFCGGLAFGAIACLTSIDESLIPKADASTPSVSLRCGDGACTLARAVCCARNFADTDYRNGHCTVADECESGDYFTCQRTSDCRAGGKQDGVCCVVMENGSFTRTECETSCSGHILCEPQVDSCPQGKTCVLSQGFPGLGECL